MAKSFQKTFMFIDRQDHVIQEQWTISFEVK